MRHIMIAVVLVLISCERAAPKEPVTHHPLQAKYTRYLALAENLIDAHGWPVRDCDALLWASLYNRSGGNAVLDAARDDRGRWHRTPGQNCWPDHSASTISQDMLLGLLIASYHERAKRRVDELIAYGEGHIGPLNTWVMGDGAVARTLMRPSLQATAYEVRFRLGGADHEGRYYPQIWGEATGFRAHLAVLHLWLRAELWNGANPQTMKWLRWHAERQPRNALFQAVYHRYKDGNQSEAVAILMDPGLFPTDRLPTSADRCEPYLWQRDDGDSWQPCPGDRGVLSHPGIDFLIAATIAMGK